MLAYKYTFTNIFNGKSFTIGEDSEGNDACLTGKGLILQSYPGFLLDVRNEEIVKSGQHGIWDFFSFYGKRNLTFQGLIKAGSHAEVVAYERKMQEVLSLPAQPVVGVNDGYVRVEWEDDNGDIWSVMAKIQQDLQFTRQIKQQLQANFFLSLKVTDPFIVSKTENEVVGLMGWRQGQFIVPGFIPNNINIVFNNAISIYQKGNTDAPAIYRLYGACDNPKITRLDEIPAQETLLADFNSTENWSGGTIDIDHIQSGNEARKLTSINGVQATMVLTQPMDLDYDEFYSIETILSSTDVSDGWSVVGDADNLQVDTLVKMEGTASLSFDILAASTPNNYAGIKNSSLIPISLENYKNVYIETWVYIPNVTNVTGIYLDLSSDSGGVNGAKQTVAVDYQGNPLAAGFNKIRFYLDNMTPYGTGLDRSSIQFVESRIVYSAGQSDMFGCRFDSFILYGDIKRQFVTFFFYIDDVTKMEIGDYLTGKNYIKFIENSGVDEFVVEFNKGNNTIRNGWNYFRCLKDEFEIIGTPIWTNITAVEFSIRSIAGGTLNITFDELKVKNCTFNETYLKLLLSLASNEYVDFDVQGGTIIKNDGSDVSGYLTLESTWFYIVPGKNTLLYESDASPPVSWEFPTQQVKIFWSDTLI